MVAGEHYNQTLYMLTYPSIQTLYILTAKTKSSTFTYIKWGPFYSMSELSTLSYKTEREVWATPKQSKMIIIRSNFSALLEPLYIFEAGQRTTTLSTIPG